MWDDEDAEDGHVSIRRQRQSGIGDSLREWAPVVDSVEELSRALGL